MFKNRAKNNNTNMCNYKLCSDLLILQMFCQAKKETEYLNDFKDD